MCVVPHNNYYYYSYTYIFIQLFHFKKGLKGVFSTWRMVVDDTKRFRHPPVIITSLIPSLSLSLSQGGACVCVFHEDFGEEKRNRKEPT